MSKEINSSALSGSLLGQAFGKLATSRNHPDGCFVLLTKELVDHIARLYDDTDWEHFEDDDKDTLELPDDIFCGELDKEKLESHIGECVFLSVFGEPWEWDDSEKTIPHGLQLCFLDESLEMAISLLDDAMANYYMDECVWELKKAVNLMIQSGMPEEVIRLKFENQLIKNERLRKR